MGQLFSRAPDACTVDFSADSLREARRKLLSRTAELDLAGSSALLAFSCGKLADTWKFTLHGGEPALNVARQLLVGKQSE